MLEMWILSHQIQEWEMTLVWCHQCQVYIDTNSHIVICAIPVNLLCLSSDYSAQNGYNGVMMSAMASKKTASRLFTQPFIQAQFKENIKAPRHLPLWGEIYQWPVTSLHKSPVTRKMFLFGDVIMIDAESIIILIRY